MHSDLLHTAQSGFRNLFSCETALANLTNKWAESIDNGLLNGVVLLDLQKAFDLIDHKLLLAKLKLYKCSPQSMKWFESYLDGRAQCTSLNGCTSQRLPVSVGVPQGSILGPLFFIVFINDLPLYLPHSNIDMYADDSSITSSAHTVQELNERLNTDLNHIATWCNENRMAANSTKTKSMLITTWQKRNSLPADSQSLSLYLNGEPLENVSREKLLGVHINHNLAWDEHIYHTEKIINKKLALLRKIKCYLPIPVRKLFYDTHILPHLDYCSTIWGSSSFIHKLLLIQKRAARMILDITDFRYPSHCMFNQLKWMPIHNRIEYRKVTMVYRSLNNLAPRYMRDMFKYVSEVNTRNTRSANRNDLYLAGRKHKDIYMKSFAFSGAQLWNRLKPEIRNKDSIKSFKCAFTKDYFNSVVNNS
jgi:hypothetical protein